MNKLSALGKLERTDRGLEVIDFKDRYDRTCSIQQSSLAVFTTPGTSAIWLGRGRDRMHLDIKMVKALELHLRRWIEDGTLELTDEEIDEFSIFVEKINNSEYDK